MKQEKSSALREVRKLNHTLQTWGNILVSSLDGKEITVTERLDHFLTLLKDKYRIDTLEKLIVELDALETEYPSN